MSLNLAVNMRRHPNLIGSAKERGRFVCVDRATPWGNPSVLGRDGGRATVIARYRDDHLPARPDLLARLGEVRGYVPVGLSETSEQPAAPPSLRAHPGACYSPEATAPRP